MLSHFKKSKILHLRNKAREDTEKETAKEQARADDDGFMMLKKIKRYAFPKKARHE